MIIKSRDLPSADTLDRCYYFSLNARASILSLDMSSCLMVVALGLPCSHVSTGPSELLPHQCRESTKDWLTAHVQLINEFQIWAYIADRILRWKCAGYLVKDPAWPRWARFMVKDWMYEDKCRARGEFGGVFLVVSLGGSSAKLQTPRPQTMSAPGRRISSSHQRKRIIGPMGRMIR
jgi:hypothetical protein